MAEALVAVSIAANIVQFLDVGSRFVTGCWEIHVGLEELYDLQKITEDFDEVLKDLERSGREGKSLPGEDHGFQTLVANCHGLASQLLDSLRKINTPNKARKRDTIREAINRLWNDEISSLRVRLERLRQELIVHLLGLIRRQGQKSMEQQNALQEQIQALGEGGKRVENAVARLLDSQAGIGDTILRTLVSRTRIVEQQQSVQNLQGDLISALHHEAAVDESNDTQAPLVSSQRERHLQKIFLGRLRYHDMEDREGRIAEAHEKTFRWIFDDDTSSHAWSNFKDWLESESKLYWITGKAGSGKSTLMKYICQTKTVQYGSSATKPISHRAGRRCDQHLCKWAGNLRLVFASFYFWNSGVPLQMSQRGLLLSLLSQILHQTPDIIATISPRRWESLCLFNEDPQEWNDSELQGILRSAVRECCKSRKICLFIDGLDEFDGKHEDLISLIMGIVANFNVKVCVASRPWVEFKDAFDHEPNLLLQDLTYSDIKHFVVTKLQKDANYDQLRRRERIYADQLVENIITKSSGVFLWVNLVVKSLLAGMNNGDRVADLQKRLDLLPPDLERLYDKILGSLDPFYLEHAAQLFKIVQESPSPPSLLVLSFADEVDLESAIRRPFKPITRDEESLRLDAMRRRLNSRCRGLLEVSAESYKDSKSTVQYLHRTVREYICSERAQRTLKTSITSSFNPHESLCAGYLAHLKTLDASPVLFTILPYWASIEGCLDSTARLQRDSPASTISVLDELRKIANEVAAQRRRHFPPPEYVDRYMEDLITRCIIFPKESEFHFALKEKFRRCFTIKLSEFGTDFLAFIVYHGLVDYVQGRATSQTNITSPLLMYAIATFYQLEKTRSQLQMIECLLTKGADPNFQVSKGSISRTVWSQMIKLILMDGYDGGTIASEWHNVVQLMIQHGAKAEEHHLCEYDPLMLVSGKKGSLVAVGSPQSTSTSKVKDIFRRDTMRLSKVLKQEGDFRIIDLPRLFGGTGTRDDLMKLRLYNQIQDIRRQTETGRLSHLAQTWKRK